MRMRLIVRHRPVVLLVIVLSQALVFYLGRLSSDESKCLSQSILSEVQSANKPKTYILILIMSAPSKQFPPKHL
jgi:hypothetical protein